MYRNIDLDSIVDEVVQNARHSAVVIGRRLAPSFYDAWRVVGEDEERVAPEEAVDIDIMNLKDIPFDPIDDIGRVVVGIDGGQRYCGAIADLDGFVGAVKAAATATVKVEDDLFQVDTKHCFTMGPYLLPFLY